MPGCCWHVTHIPARPLEIKAKQFLGTYQRQILDENRKSTYFHEERVIIFYKEEEGSVFDKISRRNRRGAPIGGQASIYEEHRLSLHRASSFDVARGF
jgi:hypothetical protein